MIIYVILVSVVWSKDYTKMSLSHDTRNSVKQLQMFRLESKNTNKLKVQKVSVKFFYYETTTEQNTKLELKIIFYKKLLGTF